MPELPTDLVTTSTQAFVGPLANHDLEFVGAPVARSRLVPEDPAIVLASFEDFKTLGIRSDEGLAIRSVELDLAWNIA